MDIKDPRPYEYGQDSNGSDYVATLNTVMNLSLMDSSKELEAECCPGLSHRV
jgi:hypothetical protein